MKNRLHLIITAFLISIYSFCFSQNADINLLKRLNSTSSIKADKFFIGITHSAAPVNIGVPTGFFISGVLSKNPELKMNSYKQASSIALSSIIALGLKYSINRERPYNKYEFITKKVNEHTPSFPSGHTAASFATATILTLQYPKWQVAVPAYAWASAVAYSRMRLGVHYPSDVVAGIIIGAGSSFLVHKVSQKWK